MEVLFSPLSDFCLLGQQKLCSEFHEIQWKDDEWARFHQGNDAIVIHRIKRENNSH